MPTPAGTRTPPDADVRTRNANGDLFASFDQDTLAYVGGQRPADDAAHPAQPALRGPDTGWAVRTKTSTAIVIPFRDRERHLEKFVAHFARLLESWSDEIVIVVVEQFDDQLFNRGFLFNVGLDYLLEGEGLRGLGRFDCIVIHDVDLLPSEQVRCMVHLIGV